MPNASTTGTLYLVPNTLGKTPENNTIPDYVLQVICRLDVLIVENIQSAVRYLQWVGDAVPDYEIDFLLLNKKTPAHEMQSFLNPLKKGRDAGLLSEAGCPVVADPGSELLKMAHAQSIRVQPLVGPSSILLALMASGFNGQKFSFHGYLPIDDAPRKKAIRELEETSTRTGATQLFMEAPHRNDAVLKTVLNCCSNTTRFCTASDLTLPSEQIISRSIQQWKTSPNLRLGKKPTIFLLSAS